MEELLNKIFESEVLTEESKNTIKEAFSKALSEAVEAARTKTEQDVKAELAEQFIADKAALVEALDTKSEAIMRAELEELKEDIQKFRDLEVEKAAELVEARKEIAAVVKKDMGELVESLNTFLEYRCRAEFTELKEGIEESKKNAFGKKIFESFASEFKKQYQNEDDTLSQLEESNAKLNDTAKALKEANEKVQAFERNKEMTRVLESLTGKPREIMEVILKNSPTEKLDETYKTFIGKVLHEGATVDDKSEKEKAKASVLAENNISTDENKDVKVTVKTVNGDNNVLKEEQAQINESANKTTISPEMKAYLRKLSGQDD